MWVEKKIRQSSRRITQEQELIHLIGVSGEYPSESIPLIIPSTRYSGKVKTALKKDGIVRVVSEDSMKGYRLTEKGRRKLLEENRARFEGVFAEGGIPSPSEVVKRKRMLSQAAVMTIMYKSGVQIYDDEKADIFGNAFPPLAAEVVIPSQSKSFPNVPKSQTTDNSQAHLSAPKEERKGTPGEVRVGSGIPRITHPSYYGSREYKRGDWELQGKYGTKKPLAVKGSRSTGVLLTPTHIYNIYNTGSTLIKWGADVERKWKEEITSGVSRGLLVGQYNGQEPNGILIGKSMDMLIQYLTVDKKQKSIDTFLTRVYDSFYYLTNDWHGILQMQFLLTPLLYENAQKIIMARYNPRSRNYSIVHDALTDDNRPVLLALVPNIPRLIRFRNGLEAQGKTGIVMCFSYQKEALVGYLGECAEVRGADFDRVKEAIEE